MIHYWDTLLEFLTPSFWYSWLSGEQTCSSSNGLMSYRGDDTCAKCNRFLALHSRKNGYCSYHNVQWKDIREVRNPYNLFRDTYEMWLRSRCGADMDESLITFDLSTLASFLEFALENNSSDGNMYDFADDVLSNYQLVYDYMDFRRAQEHADLPSTMKSCESLHHFIEFRKFQLPIKGIIENRYSATERLLQSYMSMLKHGSTSKLLNTTTVTYEDVKTTVDHFTPQFEIIIDFFSHCNSVRSLESGCDLEFSTSFLCAYLYSVMPQYVEQIHMVRVRDLKMSEDEGDDVEIPGKITPSTEVDRFVTGNIASPVIANACISKMQKLMTLDPKVHDVIVSYVNYIRPRLTKANDYLLLDSNSLGLSQLNVQDRIRTLIYRATGKLTTLSDKLTAEEPTRVDNSSQVKQSKKVSFSSKITRKIVKRYARRNRRVKKRKQLLLDLGALSVSR